MRSGECGAGSGGGVLGAQQSPLTFVVRVGFELRFSQNRPGLVPPLPIPNPDFP
jgi:hypothetical protein